MREFSTEVKQQALELLEKAEKLIMRGENWTQKAYARNDIGEVVSELSNEAVCFCSYGALYNVNGSIGYSEPVDVAIKTLTKAFGASIANYNDSHSHVEVLAKFGEAVAMLRKEVEAANGAPVQS